MQGIMAVLLKKAVKSYLEDRLRDRFEAGEYEVLAEEFKRETTPEEFTALRKSDGDERRELIRTIASRIQTRVNRSGNKDEKDLMKRFMKARKETSTPSASTAARKTTRA